MDGQTLEHGIVGVVNGTTHTPHTRSTLRMFNHHVGWMQLLFNGTEYSR